MKKRVLKKEVKIYSVVIVAALILLIILINVIKYHKSDIYKLKKIGYEKDIALKIIDLNKVEQVLNIPYQDNILDIMKSKYYMDKNLTKYIEYYNSNKNKSIEDVISIVNTHRDSKFYSLDLKADLSKGFATMVNKYYLLDKDYEPENLVDVKNWYAYGNQKLDKEVYDRFVDMYNDAQKEGLKFIINDAYRTYESQVESYKKYGDDLAAKPGASEHNLGFAVDLIAPGYKDTTFDTSNEFAWLSKNAHKYGFILRYPKDKENITGYAYESWHYRYLGKDLATKVYNSGLTYEEYYAYYIEK